MYAVCGTAEDHRVQLFKLIDALAECRDLRWANKGEVQRIEEEDDPPAPLIFEGKPFKLAVCV